MKQKDKQQHYEIPELWTVEIQSVANKVSVKETHKICTRYYLIPGVTKATQWHRKGRRKTWGNKYKQIKIIWLITTALFS
jgi:hypothetical protein